MSIETRTFLSHFAGQVELAMTERKDRSQHLQRAINIAAQPRTEVARSLLDIVSDAKRSHHARKFFLQRDKNVAVFLVVTHENDVTRKMLFDQIRIQDERLKLIDTDICVV